MTRLLLVQYRGDILCCMHTHVLRKLVTSVDVYGIRGC